MSSLVYVTVIIVLVTVMTSHLVSTSPVRSPADKLSVERRAVENGDTVLTLVLDASQGREAIDSDVEEMLRGEPAAAAAGAEDHGRNKRDAHQGSRHDSRHRDVPVVLDDDELSDMGAPDIRQRRSAAWWVSAMVALCDKYNVCREAHISEGDVDIVLRLSEI